MYLEKKDILEKLIINPGTKKCFIFDLDGTIIFRDRPLIARYNNLLRKIHESGHSVIFASGRSNRDFQMLMPEWMHDLSRALFGGGMTFHQGSIIRKNSIDKAHVLDLIKICEKNKIPYILDDHLNYYHPKSSDSVYKFIDDSIVSDYRVYDLEQILVNDIFKIFVLQDDTKLFEEYAKTNPLGIHYHKRFNTFDILPLGVNKFSGIEGILAHHSNDVFVFGDDYNDYPLFMNFHNSILLGKHHVLKTVAKIQIINDIMRYHNLNQVITTILEV